MGGTDGDLLLQMDIEGAEWLALAQVSDRVLSRFRIIVLELHGLRPGGPRRRDDVPAGAREAGRPVRRRPPPRQQRQPDVPQPNYDIAPIVELTLLRKDRSQRRLAHPATPTPARPRQPARPPEPARAAMDVRLTAADCRNP